MEETLNEIFALFHLATDVKRSLVKNFLNEMKIDLLDFLKDNVNNYNLFADVKQALANSSFIKPNDLTLGTVNLLLSLCGEMFWKSCFNSQDISFEIFLNNHKSEIEKCLSSKSEHGKLPGNFVGSDKLDMDGWSYLFEEKTGHATHGIQVSHLDKELSFTLLNICCPLLQSVIVLTERQSQICIACVEMESLDQVKVKEIWDTMQYHILAVAEFCEFCEREKYFKSQINAIQIRRFNNSEWFGNRKSILDVALSDTSFIGDEEFCNKARKERILVEYEETKIVTPTLCGKEIQFEIHGGCYRPGQYPVAVLDAAGKCLEIRVSLYGNQDGGEQEHEIDKGRLTDEDVERINYLKLVQLVAEVGRDVLIDVAKNRLPAANFGDEFNKMKTRLQPLLTRTQRDKLFPSSGNYTGDLTDLDLSLLYLILRNLNTIAPPKNGWGENPDESDHEVADNMERLRIAKNTYVSHSACFAVTQSDFEKLWKEYRQCIIELGGSSSRYESVIDELLTRSVNQTTERELMKAIAEIKEDQREMNKENMKMRRELNIIHENVCRILANKTNSSRGTEQKNTECLSGTSNSVVIVKIHAQNLPAIADYISCTSLNSEYVTVNSVKDGSILIHTELSPLAFQSVEYFLAVIDGFLLQLFSWFPSQQQSEIKQVVVAMEFCDPPSMHVVQQKYTVQSGRETTLNCYISSVPCLTNVCWKKQNKITHAFQWIAEHNFKYLMKFEGPQQSLALGNVEDEDDAMYTCFAENCFGGTESIPIELKVLPDEALQKNMYEWLNVRRGTIPKLKRLKSKMKTANNRIKTTRRRRNWVLLGAGLTGILAAPFTAFTSVAASTAFAMGGTVIVAFAIDKYIESGVLAETQSQINADVEATLVLLAQFRLYISEASYSKFARAFRDIKLEAIGKLSTSPLESFINSLVSTDNVCLLRAVDVIESIEIELSDELEQVEDLNQQYSQ